MSRDLSRSQGLGVELAALDDYRTHDLGTISSFVGGGSDSILFHEPSATSGVINGTGLRPSDLCLIVRTV